uniref:UBX domain-containing protein 11 n=1 Tax=Strigops habroptila TaxID=2489341 RepID=A0A672UZ89_STRHB
MFNRAFRPYEDPSTQQCLQDIMDGYFPSELQMHYPDGIPLQVTDRRDVVFQERHLPGSFPGHGQVVGHSKSSEVQETTEIPGKFLNLSFSHKLILVKVAEEAEAPAPGVCALRIKSESGEQTYTVKMLFTETIGDLRQHLGRARGGDSNSYEIISTFPQRVYTDNSRSLQECGLTPNACLLLQRRDPHHRSKVGTEPGSAQPGDPAAGFPVREQLLPLDSPQLRRGPGSQPQRAASPAPSLPAAARGWMLQQDTVSLEKSIIPLMLPC